MSHCVKRYGHLCKIYQNRSDMVMSRDSGFKFRKFLLSPNSVLNFWKIYQIWGEIGSRTKSYRQKTNWEWKTPPPQVLLGLTERARINSNR